MSSELHSATGAAALRWSFGAALGCFLLAGLTGSLLRLGALQGLPLGLDFINVHHAHSHLMFFGWVTPALMGLIAVRLAAAPGERGGAGFGAVIVTTLLFGLLAYPPFLLSGYGATAVGPYRLPLSVAASGLNMLAWYAFMGAYLRSTRGRPRSLPLRYVDGALALLLLSTVAAWSLAPAVAVGVGPVLRAALIALFLELFSAGWFVLALLGLACAQLRPRPRKLITVGLVAMLAGLPLSPLATQRLLTLPAVVEGLAVLSAVVAALGLLLSAVVLTRAAWQRRAWYWLPPLALFGFRAVVGAVAAIPASGPWLEGLGLRVFFLHAFLLGAVTLGVVAAAHHAWGSRATVGRWVLALAVGLLCASLVPLSGVWPASWSGRWILTAALIGSLLPLPAVAVMALVPLLRRPPTVRKRSASIFRWILPGVALAIVVAVVLVPGRTGSAAATLPGLTLEHLDGHEVELAELEGRPVVINLWATWCGPCRRELPMMAEMARGHPDVTFVFADQREERDQVERFLAEHDLHLELVLLDTGGRLADVFRSPGLPTTLFFDTRGELVQAHLGEITAATLFNHVNALVP